MALFRDTQIIKKILKPDWQIEQEAQIFLFLTVEEKLRDIIQEAMKYQRHLMRDKVTTQDVEQAIQNQNISNVSSTILGFNYMSSVTWTKKIDSYSLNDMNRDLKDLISSEIEQIKVPIQKPQLSLQYILKEGKVANTSETQHILSQREIIAKQMREKEESQKQFAVIKDSVIEILSPLQRDQLYQFTEKFNQEVLNKGISKEFQSIIKSLQIYKDVAGILPFLINFFYVKSEGNGVFAFETKHMILESLEALIQNKNLNLEFHLHILIKILINFLTTQVDSGSYLRDNLFYEKVGKLLNLIVLPFEDKYFFLRTNINKIMMQLLQTFLNSMYNNSQLQIKREKYDNETQYFNLHICCALIQYFGCNLNLKSVESLLYIIANVQEQLQNTPLLQDKSLQNLEQKQEKIYILRQLLLKIEFLIAQGVKQKMSNKEFNILFQIWSQTSNTESFLIVSPKNYSTNELNIIL